jgi:hypothetical protein
MHVPRRRRFRAGPRHSSHRAAALLGAVLCATFALAASTAGPSAFAASATVRAAHAPLSGGAHRQGPVIPAPKHAPAAGPTAAELATCAEDAYAAGWPMDVEVNAGTFDGTADGTWDETAIATAIAYAESSCNPAAENTGAPQPCSGSGSPYPTGLFQIVPCDWTKANANGCLTNGQCNADAAFNYVYHADGFCAWATWSGAGCKGSYDNFGGGGKTLLQTAQQAVDNLQFELQDPGTGKCVAADASQKKNGGAVWQYGCGSNVYDEWQVVQGGSNLNPVLRNEGTGYCLDVDGSEPSNQGLVEQWACNSAGDPHQRWYVVANSAVNTSLKANFNLRDSKNNTCLAANAAEPSNEGTIWQWTCSGYSGNRYLQWNLVDASVR